ncbi:minor head protein [Bacillus phage Basilisk]|uniref:ILEI/PANDER domain-containing protein n=1 Tax=Bacillus phage Basilisk TaxID=1296654 RepID=S5MLU2_9CAUD|nr:minor head protein [Bacillus phage Basilisk]AGR46595.1 hypothetical protein BASILISK_51 [Bacillus phage Basilisk]
MVKQLISSASITLQDLSDAIISGTQPTNPKLDQLWIKRTDGKPDELYRWNGTAWVDQTLDLNKLDPDADGKIEKHDITIGNMVNDSVIDITERQEVKNKISPLIGRAVVDTDGSIPSAAQLWTAGVGEVWAIRKAAQNVGIKNTEPIYLAVETAYNALQAYLNGTSPIRPWDASAANKDKVITVVPTEWRSKWVDYYKAVQSLTTEIQTKLQGNIDGIIIGGENLFDGTSFDDAVGWSSWANLGRVGVYDITIAGKSLYVETKDKTTGNQLDVPINTPVGLQSGADKSIKVLKDQEYTVSANIATSEMGNTLDYTYILHTNSADNMKINTLTVTSFPQIKPVYEGAKYFYHHVTFTFKAKMDDDIRILIGGRTTRELKPSAGVTGYAWIRINELKVEKGNKATAWKPSQKDINKLISDADAKAQKVTDSVNDMSIDSKLTPVEKIQLKTDYESITAEFTTTLNSADAFNLTSSSERVAYNAAYNSLKTFVDPLLLKMTETSAVDRNTFRQRFKDYYDTKAKLLKKISDTSKGLIDSTGQSNGNILRNAMWADGEKFWAKSANTANHTLEFLDNAYLKQKVYRQTVVNETADKWHAIFSDYFPASPNQTFTFSIYANTPDTTKLDYPAWMIAEWFDSAGTRLLRGSVSLTASGNNRWERFSFTTTVPEGAVKGRLRAHLTRNGQIYYAKPMVQLGSYLGEWGVSHLDFNLQEIEKTTEESKNNIANMSNDSKLTPIEKVQLKKEWAVIYAEKPQYESLGVSFKATTEVNAYINAYNVLNSTLNNSTNGYLKNMQSTEDINGATFRAQFDDYYDKKSVLIKRVNQIIQGNIDNMEVKTANYVFNSTFKFGSSNWSGIDTAATRNVTTVKGLEGYGIYTGLRITDATSFITQIMKPEPFVATKGFVSTYINVKVLQTANTNKPRIYMRFAYDQGDPTKPKYYYAICSQDTVTDGWIRISLPFDTRSYTGKLIEVRVNLATADMTSADVEFAGVMVNLGDKLADWIPSADDTVYGEIFLQGSGQDQNDKRRILKVNGKEIYNQLGGRGLRLVTLKKNSLQVAEDITYDVYGSDAERTNLANKLNSIGDDVFITLSSYDAIQWGVNLRNAMMSIGGSGVDATYRTPYAFIGMKGLGRYNGLEQYTGSGSLFGLAQISAKVNDGMLQGMNNNTGAADNIMRQDLRITAPLPTSISLDSNGITASTTTAGKYARLDYRGLYIAGGAIQIDGGLSEAQLAAGVKNKFTYIDESGVYTGKVVADQINGGVITGVTINVDTNLQVGKEIRLGNLADNSLKMIRFNNSANISTTNGNIMNISAMITKITDGDVTIGSLINTEIYKTYLQGTIDVSGVTNWVGGGVPAVFG